MMEDFERAHVFYVGEYPLVFEQLHAQRSCRRARFGAYGYHDVGLGARIQTVRFQRAREHIDADRCGLLAIP
jgi:hypothetical protein